MADGTRVLTDALIEARVRSAVADELAQSIDRRRILEFQALAAALAEISRLRGLVEVQAAEIADLRRRLAEAEAASRELPVDDLLRAIAGSVTAGAATLEGYAVSRARVEVRAALGVSGAGLGLRAADATLADPAALGTVAVDLHALPPTPSQEAAARAVADLLAAAAGLQAALDRDLPDAAREAGRSALARASMLAATSAGAPTSVTAVAEPLTALVAGMQALAGHLPALADSVAALAARHARLQTAPTDPAAVDEATGALRAVAAAVERLPP
jgi:hypothetical protein